MRTCSPHPSLHIGNAGNGSRCAGTRVGSSRTLSRSAHNHICINFRGCSRVPPSLPSPRPVGCRRVDGDVGCRWLSLVTVGHWQPVHWQGQGPSFPENFPRTGSPTSSNCTPHFWPPAQLHRCSIVCMCWHGALKPTCTGPPRTWPRPQHPHQPQSRPLMAAVTTADRASAVVVAATSALVLSLLAASVVPSLSQASLPFTCAMFNGANDYVSFPKASALK